MKRKKIVVVGSVNVDFAVRTPRLPVEGETVSRAKFDIFFGGKGGNQAVAAARLGMPTAMVARTGDDAFGKQLRSSLREAGVNVRAVQTARKVHTGTAFVITDHRGANQIVVAPGANATLGVADLVRNRSLLRSAGLILAQLEVSQAPIAKLAEMAHEFGVPFILDPAPARKLPLSLLRRVSILTPNETEACFLAGRKPRRLDRRSGAQLCRRLLKLGIQPPPVTPLTVRWRWRCWKTQPFRKRSDSPTLRRPFPSPGRVPNPPCPLAARFNLSSAASVDGGALVLVASPFSPPSDGAGWGFTVGRLASGGRNLKIRLQ
jgi:ribokinase